jgi:general secretion pathway protein M
MQLNRIEIGAFFAALWQKAGLDRLEPRERWVLLGGLCFVGAFLVLQLLIMPFFVARGNLEGALLRREADLVKIAELREEYLALKEEEGGIQAGVEGRNPDFSLFTFLDRQAEASQVKKQISSMKPTETEGDGVLDEVMVEVNLQQVSLQGLVDFLLLVESAENVVFVRRISIQESGRGSNALDVALQIVTFAEKG